MMCQTAAATKIPCSKARSGGAGMPSTALGAFLGSQTHDRTDICILPTLNQMKIVSSCNFGQLTISQVQKATITNLLLRILHILFPEMQN